MTALYYQDELVTLYLGDAREITEWRNADVLLVDPPYGIAYNSGSRRDTLAASIAGDLDTSLRDDILAVWGDRPALVFGTWRIPRPTGTHTRLIWDTKGALGMMAKGGLVTLVGIPTTGCSLDQLAPAAIDAVRAVLDEHTARLTAAVTVPDPGQLDALDLLEQPGREVRA